MNREAMLQQFLELEPSTKILMLLAISFELTLLARDIDDREPLADSHKLKYARGMSEINHQIIQSVISRLEDSDSRYPDDVLVDILYETFEKYELQPYFSFVWDRALRKARRSGARVNGQDGTRA
jgi:hypothetical protein